MPRKRPGYKCFAGRTAARWSIMTFASAEDGFGGTFGPIMSFVGAAVLCTKTGSVSRPNVRETGPMLHGVQLHCLGRSGARHFLCTRTGCSDGRRCLGRFHLEGVQGRDTPCQSAARPDVPAFHRRIGTHHRSRKLIGRKDCRRRLAYPRPVVSRMSYPAVHDTEGPCWKYLIRSCLKWRTASVSDVHGP